MRDITEIERLKNENITLRQHIKELEAKESTLNCLEYSTIFKIISEIICVLDLETNRFSQVNPAFKKLVGLEGDEIYSRPFFDFIHPDDREKTFNMVNENLRKGKQVISFENRYLNSDGNYSLLEWTAYPVLDQNAVYTSARDITEQKAYEQQLEFQSQLLDQIEDRITATDLEGMITYVNQAEIKTFGLDSQDFIGKNVDIYGEDKKYVRQQEIIKQTKENGFWNGKVVNFDKLGNRIILNSRIRLFYDKSGEPAGMIGISTDITKAIEANLKLESALEEKETLLRELYHRTKNNMQVICAMLDLEAMNVDNPALEVSFQEMSHRIQTMSLVHNKLYQTKQLSRIDLKDYLKDLAVLLLQSNSNPELEISLETELITCNVVIDIAIPIGLVINELITNSMKYAFTGRQKGKIDIHLERIEGLLILTYSDNGVGFPEGFDIKKDHNLGLLLVQKLVNGQLGGKLRSSTDDGCAFQIRFSEMIYNERV